MSENDPQLENEIRAIISKIIEVEEDKITPGAHLVEDLGSDSMQVLEIMVALDKKYKISINEADLPQMINLQKTVEIVKTLQSQK